MFTLFDFCNIHWFWPWLLPFLLGLGLGWLFWARYKSIVKDSESKISDLNLLVKSMEKHIETVNKSKSDLEENMEYLRQQLRKCQESKVGNAIKLTPTSKDVNLSSSTSSSLPNLRSSNEKWNSAIGNNNLQIIEGIGPKMEEILKENGILDFTALKSLSQQDLNDILNKYGEKYRLINPNTWPQQATLAADKKWEELIALQKHLEHNKKGLLSDSSHDSKLHKWLVKAKIIQNWSQDDLKAVEGIGPKIEEVLQNSGITTWQILAETTLQELKDILLSAGVKFALADPTTWPKQAQMASQGMWDELSTYQEYLKGGKER